MNQLITKYACICDRKKPELAATIVSYLGEKGSYFPLFEFPFASTIRKDVAPDAINEESMSIQRSEGTVITINNAIARMGGCELLIFAGLSKEQKSFLGMWEKRNHIFIDNAEEIDF